jgi:hypothetical protein
VLKSLYKSSCAKVTGMFGSLSSKSLGSILYYSEESCSKKEDVDMTLSK